MTDKARLRDELLQLLMADLATRERAYRSAREGATSDEAKPENDKDTRALEQSYLARGEARRIEELRAAIVAVEAMAIRDLGAGDIAVLGALVTVQGISEEGEPSTVWLAAHGGGSRIAQGTVQVLTPGSPMGRALLGKRKGDACEVALAGKTRELLIVAVR